MAGNRYRVFGAQYARRVKAWCAHSWSRGLFVALCVLGTLHDATHKGGYAETIPVVAGAARQSVALVLSYGGTEDEEDGEGAMIALGNIVVKNMGLDGRLDVRIFYRSLRDVPDYGWWRENDIDIVMHGAMHAHHGRLTLSLRFWDVDTERYLGGNRYQARRYALSKLAHFVSDDLYHMALGRKSDFPTRIAYIAEFGAGRTGEIRRWLAVMDVNGGNHRFIARWHDNTSFPLFLGDSEELLYVLAQGHSMRFFVFDLSTGRHEYIDMVEGRHAPFIWVDSHTSLVMGAMVDGKEDIMMFHLKTGQRMALTDDTATDWSPTLYGRGDRVAFLSDRGGVTALYTVPLPEAWRDGAQDPQDNIVPLPHQPVRPYDMIVHAPHRDGFFAFYRHMGSDGAGAEGTGTEGEMGTFDSMTGKETIVLRGDIAPHIGWAPSGCCLLYAERGELQQGQQRKMYRLKVLDIDTQQGFPLTIPFHGRYAVWSPFMTLE
ncbi:MAG: hypothetical protein GDA54_05550 [Alphaproteobacteria bacterium GM7ARS4]|nr:hypothetical protein [Alphaproteobacteria bacterium GM7ARS4]